jgi:hypothetical protein
MYLCSLAYNKRQPTDTSCSFASALRCTEHVLKQLSRDEDIWLHSGTMKNPSYEQDLIEPVTQNQ